MAFAGCSDAPKEYSKGTVVTPVLNPDQQTPAFFKKPETIATPEGTISSDELLKLDPSDMDFGGAGFDAKVDSNSKKPMIYAVGAAGITFDTTYSDSRQFVVPRTPPNINGDAVYEEQMQIRWKMGAKPEDQKPIYFILFPGYRGEVQVPAPYAPFKMGHDFSNQYSVNQITGAEAMVRDFYRMFEGKEQDFDCLQLGLCGVSWGNAAQKEFVIVLPGMQMLLSKDRFVLFYVIVDKNVPQGVLGQSPIDMVNGRFLTPADENGVAVADISTGDSYGAIEDLLQITTETSVGTSTFGRNYSGIYLGYNRTDFDRDADQPLATDLLKEFAVFRDYTKNLTINGLPVIVREYADDIELSVATTSTFTDKTDMLYREIPLRMSLGLKPTNVLVFAQKLGAFMDEQLKKALPNSEITTRVTGLNQKKDIKSYSVYTIAYDKAASKGLFVQFDVDQDEGHITQFYWKSLGTQWNAIDDLVLSDLNSPVEKAVAEQQIISIFNTPVTNDDGTPKTKIEKLPYYSSLSKFNIGDEVIVKNWDLGRYEADITYMHPIQRRAAGGEMLESRVPMTVRGGYADKSLMNMAFDTSKEVPVELAFVDVGSMNVSLGLKLVNQTADTRVYKVATISSALKQGEVRDLCGSFTTKIGTPANDILKQLRALPNCEFRDVSDTGGNGRLTRIYFPKDRIRLNFAELELTGLTVYWPLAEVQ